MALGHVPRCLQSVAQKEERTNDGDENNQAANQNAGDPLLIFEHEREGLADVH